MDNFLGLPELVVDMEHPADLSPYAEGFRLSWVGVYDGTEPRLLRPDEARVFLKDRWYTDLIIFHSGKSDITALRAAKVVRGAPTYCADTMAAANCLNEHARDLGLKPLVRSIFKREVVEFDARLDQDSDEFKRYAVADLTNEWDLWQYEKPRLKRDGLEDYYHNVLMPALPAVADMEWAGLGWDFALARDYLVRMLELREQSERTLREHFGELNLRSRDQVRRVLFDDLKLKKSGLALTEKTEQVKINAENLEICSRRYPQYKWLSLLTTYYKADKLVGTYLIPFSTCALECRDMRIHPTFWLTSKTGRTRSSKPNLQNITVLSKADKARGLVNLRDCVVPRDGFDLLVIDFSQQELRLMAHFSQDPLFLKAYRTWVCTKCGKSAQCNVILHACPVCGEPESEGVLKGGEGFWHGQDLHQQTLDRIPSLKERKIAKIANFETIYGASEHTLAKRHPDLTVAEWKESRDSWLHTYVGVLAYHKQQESLMVQKMKCRGIRGRLRRTSRALLKANYKHELNCFYNFQDQEGGATMGYLSMAQIRLKWIERGWWLKKAFQVNAVHDELVFETEKGITAQAQVDAVYIMEHCLPLSVPMRAEAKVCARWSEMKG